MATKKRERRRGARREGRNERLNQLHSGGGEWDCIRIPEGLEVFKPEEGTTYHIDIIPYIVGDMNPNADAGDEYWELSYPVYNNLGVDEKRYIAIGELLGQRDPVAEHFARLRKAGAEWDDMKDFKHKWRQLMLVFVHEQADKGLQLFEGAFGTFGEMLKEELEELGEEEWAENLDDPDGGATVKVRFKGKNIGMKNLWVCASKINIEERENGFDADGDPKLAEEILEKAASINLEACLKIPDYDTLKAALDGEPTSIPRNKDGDADDDQNLGDPFEGKGKDKTKAEKPAAKEKDEPEDEPEEKPKAKAKRNPPTAESLGIVKGCDVEHEEFGLCTVLRIAADGLSITIMDENDGVHKGIDPTDVEPVDATDTTADAANAPAEEKPAAKAKGKDKETPKTGGKDKATKEKPGKGDGDWDDDWD